MLAVARLIHGHKTFYDGNAETWGNASTTDMSTCMFAFHEMPSDARYRVLQNMLRVAPLAIVVDIHPSYLPSARMLKGEPYLASYLRHASREMVDHAAKLDAQLECVDIITARVILWRFTRRSLALSA